jgi:hypothetical protein
MRDGFIHQIELHSGVAEYRRFKTLRGAKMMEPLPRTPLQAVPSSNDELFELRSYRRRACEMRTAAALDAARWLRNFMLTLCKRIVPPRGGRLAVEPEHDGSGAAPVSVSDRA